jgi:hypothetical protein
MKEQQYDQFKKDLAIGQKYEKIALEMLLKYYHDKFTLVSTNDSSKYDFKLSNNLTYEVKACLSAIKYNSIFVEDTAFKKHSGIAISDANYYIFVICDNAIVQYLLLIPTRKLLQLILRDEFFKYHRDEMKSGYIFNLNVLNVNSKIIY